MEKVHLGKNFVPLPYRHVSVQPYKGKWTEKAITDHLLGRDSYRRTDYIVLHDEEECSCAVVRVVKKDPEPLFSPIVDVQVLALPDRCKWVEDPEVDTGNRTALAEKALALGILPDWTLVVRGRYAHTNFIYHPDPLRIKVAEVLPPAQPKLYEMAKLVLQYSDLPAIHLELAPIYMEELAKQHAANNGYLIPCRASGMELDVPVHYLDEHPDYQDWVMIGCERSNQIHEHFYGHAPKRIEVCPRKLIEKSDQPTLVKCCLLENHIEVEGNYAVVPWGATLQHVEEALLALVRDRENTAQEVDG